MSPKQSSRHYQQCHHITTARSRDDLIRHVERLWLVDTLPYNEKMVTRSKQDKDALTMLQDNTIRVNVAGVQRYAMPLLRRMPMTMLRAERDAVLPSLRSTEHRLARDPARAKAYCNEIRKQESAGYVAKITTEEAHRTLESWFIPHHMVHHNRKDRIVFNCSFQHHGQALNSQLLSGPMLGPSLLGVFLRFRQQTVAVSGDIKGMFHQLWQYGQWVDVVVDDRLPTIKGKLLFVKSKEETEFWSALLEKAYAKVNGCYENLIGGFPSEANEDFTGGIAEYFPLNKAPLNLFNIMEKALNRGSLLSTSISASEDQKEHKTAEQLLKTHAYSITAAQKVKVRKSVKVVELVRLRNPWGHLEWNGAWSDGSKEWDQVSPEDKAKLNYSADDGEFWMTYADYIQRYSDLEICNLTPDTPSDDLRCWNACQFEGTWKIGTTAGGCLKFPATFCTNPQYRVKLNIDRQYHKCSALVALMQKGARQAKQKGVENYTIGFYIYKYKGKQDVCLGPEDLRRPVAESEFVNVREVCQRFNLPLAEYVIIPATYEANKEASFLLRVFSEK
ncbi:calpain-2 catalytic subunit-like [Tachysurus ichikawai]